MANMLARLGVVLGLDSAEFSRGIAAAEKDLAKLAATATTYGKLAAAAFATTTISALKFADEIADTAKANDIAVDSILKLQHALQQSGGEASSAGRALNSFNSFVDKAATGNFEAQQSFKQMGVTLKDIGNLSIDQLFSKVAESLAKIDDPITRNAKAVEVFGRAIKGVDLIGFNDQLKHGTGLTEEQTQSIIDAGDAWDLLAKRMHDAMVAFTAFVGTPALKMLEYLDSLPNYIDTVKIAFSNLGETISFVNNLTAAFIMRDVGMLKKSVEDYRKIKEQIEESRKSKTGEPTAPDGSGSSGDTGPKRATTVGVDKAAEALRLKQLQFNISQRQREGKEIEDNTKRMVEQFATESLRQDAYAKMLKTKQIEFDLDIAGRHMREEDVTLAKELLAIQSNRTEKIREIKANTDLNLAAQEQLIDRESQLADEAERYAKARNEAIKTLREGTFGQGFGGEMAKFFREAPTQMEQGAQAFQSVVSNMDAALSNFVRNGKFSFKDLTRSIIQDLIMIEMRAKLTGIFRMAFAATAVGGVRGPDNIDVGGGWSPASKAGGGDVMGGRPYYVGERGPELFVPNGNGTIVPNGTLAGAMGGGGQTVNYNGPYIANMSAIDTQSSVQFLAKNKQTIWAVNQSAQRSLPVSK